MSDRPSIEVFPDRGSAALTAADAITAGLTAGLADGRWASLVATGGSSPGPVYDILSARVLPWERVRVTLSDERWVDPASPESNERLLRRRLLVGEAAGATLVPLWSRASSPDEAALAAEAAVARLLPADVTLLGMGEDGHIASLFPRSPALAEGLNPAGRRLVIAAPGGRPAPAQDRLTLTLAALTRTGLILVLTSGAAKRRILEDRDDLPVHALFQAAGEVPVRLIWSPEV